jgi:VanZ family protein
VKNFLARLRHWLPLLAWLGFIFWISTDVGSEPRTARWLAPLVRGLEFDESVPDAEVQAMNRGVRDLAHSAEYAVLALLLWMVIGARRPAGTGPVGRLVVVLGIIAVCAVADERFQLLFPSRHSTVSDTVRDVSGALIALAGVALYEWGKRRKAAPASGAEGAGESSKAAPAAEKFRRRPSSRGQRVLLVSSLHLHREGSAALEQVRVAMDYTEPDLCVLSGDLGPADRAGEWLRLCRSATRRAELVVCLGNEDHWLAPEFRADAPSPTAVRERYWRPACDAAGVRCLDFANAEVADLVFTGGFGHYDLEFRDRKLEIEGVVCEREDLLRGAWQGLEYGDFRNIPNLAATLDEEAAAQSVEISARLEVALQRGKPVVLLTHTAPFANLMASPGGFQKPAARFARAYAGNAALGAAIGAAARRVELMVCAQRGAGLPPEMRDGVFGMNLGGRGDALQFALFDARAVRSSVCRFAIDPTTGAITPG